MNISLIIVINLIDYLPIILGYPHNWLKSINYCGLPEAVAVSIRLT